MSKPLTEQKVLNKSETENSRYLTKDKVIPIVSMPDKMELDAEKQATEQFPNFSKAMEEVLHDYK